MKIEKSVTFRGNICTLRFENDLIKIYSFRDQREREELIIVDNDDNVMTVVDAVITDVLGREHFNGFVVYEPVQSNQTKNSSAVIDFTGM